MKVIVGLGNPGHNFHDTRHNVGFHVIQRLAECRQVSLRQQIISQEGHPAAVYGEYREGAETIRLLMPLTMMNESGEGLKDLAVALNDLLVVCDDVNLPLGTIRLRPEGGPGGHHGLESCLSVLGTERVPRLRVGVGVEPLPQDLSNFVLSPFHSSERPVVERALAQAAEACEAWVKDGMDVVMNRYNTKMQGTA